MQGSLKDEAFDSITTATQATLPIAFTYQHPSSVELALIWSAKILE